MAQERGRAIVRHELDPAIRAPREGPRAHPEASRSEARDVALAAHLDVERVLHRRARCDLELHLSTEQQREALGHRQRPRDPHPAEQRAVAASEVSHDEAVCRARDREVLAAERRRRDDEGTLGPPHDELVVEDQVHGATREQDAAEAPGRAPPLEGLDPFAGRGVEGRVQRDSLGCGEGLAAPAGGDEGLDLGVRLAKEALAAGLALLLGEQGLEALDLPGLRESPGLALGVAHERVRLGGAVGLAEVLELPGCLEQVLAGRRRYGGIGGERHHEGGSLHASLLFTLLAAGALATAWV